MLTEKVGAFRKEFSEYGKFPGMLAHDGFDKGCDALQHFERIFSLWPVFEMCEGEHESIRHGEWDVVIKRPYTNKVYCYKGTVRDAYACRLCQHRSNMREDANS